MCYWSLSKHNVYVLWVALFTICVDIYSVITFDTNIVFLTSV